MSARFWKTPPYDGRKREFVVDESLHWRKPRTAFVCSMTDLFHRDVTDHQIATIFRRMVQSHIYDPDLGRIVPRHTFIILTKRPERMINLIPELAGLHDIGAFDNIWLGVSVENPDYYWRISDLRQTPAVVRIVSLEPLLAPVPDLNVNGINSVFLGCESGPYRRPMELDWARDVAQQCKRAGVNLFIKQLPINGRVSHDPSEWPEDLRIRQLPKGANDGAE